MANCISSSVRERYTIDTILSVSGLSTPAIRATSTTRNGRGEYFLQGLRLEAEVMPTYLPRDQAGHPRASPGLTDTRNGGLHENAKMFPVLPEFDTLAAQSDVWIEKAANEGRSDDLSIEK